MDSGREDRVFCPPTLSKVTAISQYRWLGPSYVKDGKDAKETAERAYKGATAIHACVLQHAETNTNNFFREKFKSEGFVFDVLDIKSGEIQLVEVNPFGAVSGCGSPLFH